MNGEHKDISLLKRMQAGDRLAFKELVNRHKDYAFTVSYRILNNREDAEETAQDAFIQVFKNIGSFNFESKFTTWFYRIVFNAALMHKRKSRIFTEDIESSEHAMGVSSTLDASEAIRHNERSEAIKKAMRNLPADDVLLITLFYFKEQTLDEIANITNINADTAKVKLHRARKKLADEIKKHWKTEIRDLI